MQVIRSICFVAVAWALVVAIACAIVGCGGGHEGGDSAAAPSSSGGTDSIAGVSPDTGGGPVFNTMDQSAIIRQLTADDFDGGRVGRETTVLSITPLDATHADVRYRRRGWSTITSPLTGQDIVNNVTTTFRSLFVGGGSDGNAWTETKAEVVDS